MFDPLTNRVLVIAGSSVILLNVLFGYLHCADNFCPGDNEKDYVYEYKDDEGKKYIVIDGISVTREDYDKHFIITVPQSQEQSK